MNVLNFTYKALNKILWVTYRELPKAFNNKDILPKSKISYPTNTQDKSNLTECNLDVVNNKLDNIEIMNNRLFLNHDYFTSNDLFSDLLKVTYILKTEDYNKFSRFINRFIFLIRDFSVNFYERLNKEDKETFIKWILKQHAHINILTQEELNIVNAEFELARTLTEQENEYERFVELSSLGYNIKFHYLAKIAEDDGFYYTVVREFIRKQYQYDDIYVKSGDVILDCGAFIGDTALALAHDTNFNCELHCFEMADVSIKTINKNIEINPQLKNIIKLNQLALSDKSDETIYFNYRSSVTQSVNNNQGTCSVQTITIDDYVKRNNLNKVDFIKMDIEGAEMLALVGATETLKKFKPKLAICVYHKIDDCKTIPEFVLKSNPNYELHFGWHNRLDGWESILYAK